MMPKAGPYNVKKPFSYFNFGHLVVLRLDILFSSNHNIHKSLYDLCFWASDPLIDRFYWNLSSKVPKTQKQRLYELLWMLWFDEKSIPSLGSVFMDLKWLAIWQRRYFKIVVVFLFLPKTRLIVVIFTWVAATLTLKLSASLSFVCDSPRYVSLINLVCCVILTVNSSEEKWN